ncbi:hypothetical protein [Vibrio sp. CB1-14]|jgi:hypothetical protein|uniref:Uncharacterized protein n=1 Tax=Vibrio chaetopteri TaxID=3016528 RepID=A0AAU8BNA1_9VIBR
MNEFRKNNIVAIAILTVTTILPEGAACGGGSSSSGVSSLLNA